jgi:neutral ceramidase
VQRPTPLVFAFGLALATFCIAAEPSPTPVWRAGIGREKITPREPIWMTGYAARTHPAEGTAQDLWVKALAFEDSTGTRGILLTLDLCGITREITDRVAAEIERRYKIPRSAVMTNVSHTHCSPWLEGNLVGLRLYSPEDMAKLANYRRSLEELMVRAASAAVDSLAPAKLSWGEDLASFGMNRRTNAQKDAPRLRETGELRGPNDPRVPVLAVRSPSGELRGVLVSYACHNTTLAFYQWHGDYAGSAMVELERRHPGVTVLFTSGCGADQNPTPRSEVQHAEAHGRALADAADRALDRPMQRIEGKFLPAFADITLAIANKPTEAELRQMREKEQPNKEMYQAWSHTVSEQLRTQGEAALRYTYPIQVWKLGGLSWIGLAGEVVVEYSLRLRRELGENTWVFGYCNDVMAYIPSERVLKEGGYEGKSSMYVYGRVGPWAPGLEDKIVGKTHELIGR